MIEMLSSRLQSIKGTHYVLARRCVKLTYFFWTIFISGLALLYRQRVTIPMGTNCALHIADLFLFCYEREFMMSLSADKDAEIIEAFNSTSRYLDDLLNIDNTYCDGIVKQIYPSELQLNKANSSDTEAPFLDLHLTVSDGFVSSEIYDKRNDFDFDVVNFPFLDGTFSKFYRRHFDLVSKFHTGLKSRLKQGLSEPEFYGDLVYKFKKIIGRTDFSDHFRKIIIRYKRI